MRIVLFSASLLATGLAAAATPIDGLYGSLFGGYFYLPDNISRIYKFTKFERASFTNGYNAGARFGFQNRPLRYEGEFTYTNATANSFSAHPPFPYRFRPFVGRRHRNVAGKTLGAFGMANIYYDFPEMVPCISPFLGIGLGFGWVKAEMHNRDLFLAPPHFIVPPPFIASHHFRASSSTFAYQGTVGFTFNFVENYALNLAYRYIGTPRIANLGKTFQGNLASVGVVYRFDEYKYK